MTTKRTEICAIVSNNFKKYRKRAGLTQIALGMKIGKNTEYISQIERGIALPSIEALFVIAPILNIEPYQLLIKE